MKRQRFHKCDEYFRSYSEIRRRKDTIVLISTIMFNNVSRKINGLAAISSGLVISVQYLNNFLCGGVFN